MATTEATLPKRDDVPVEERWDLESVYATPSAWEADYRAAEARLPEMERFTGQLGASASMLLGALQRRDELAELVDRVETFATLRRSEDVTSTAAAAMAERGQGLAARFGAAIAFIEPEIAAIPTGQMTAFFASEPDLHAFRQIIERIQRRSAHIRSIDVEQLLASAAELAATPETVHDVLENGDLPFASIDDESGQPVALAQGNLGRYLRSTDRRVRRDAWETSADAYLAMRHTFAAALAGGVKKNVFYAQARGYTSSLEAALDPDNIPGEVFHGLLDTVWKNFPTWHRYFRVRRRLLGLAEGDLHGWDLTASLATHEPVIPIAQGVDLICETLAPLGAEYVATIRQGIADRWVDRSPNVGKGGGAFSWGSYGTYPFISMTYKDDLPSVSTLTHELGHSMHSYLTWRHQPVTYASYGMFAAETASNMHQALLGAHLFSTDLDDDWTLAVLDERMANHLRYLFTMPILARFELDCHDRVERGEALTADDMSDTLMGFYREGYGGEVVLDEPRIGITWARFGHLFANFYVFQYATGIAAAAALGAQVRAGGEPAARAYLTFVQTGGARDPIDALADAGIDMRSTEPVQHAFDILASYVDRLEAIAAPTGR